MLESSTVMASRLKKGDKYLDLKYGILTIEKIYPVNPKYPKGFEVETDRGRRWFDLDKIIYLQ